MGQHKHWPEDHPGYALAQWCRFKTMKACDENSTQFQHGHLGVVCVKAVQESKSRKGQPNKIATCTITQPIKPGSFKQNLDAAMAAAPDSWWEGLWEWQRVNAVALTVRPLVA